MTEFNNVAVVKKANVYYDGRVNSRTIKFADGTVKTLGFMMPGDYTFNTGAAELMEILDGDLQVMLPGENDWKAFSGGDSFEVPANSQFSVRIQAPTDYCCSFLES